MKLIAKVIQGGGSGHLTLYLENFQLCLIYPTSTSKLIMIQSPNGNGFNKKFVPLHLTFLTSPRSWNLEYFWRTCAWLHCMALFWSFSWPISIPHCMVSCHSFNITHARFWTVSNHSLGLHTPMQGCTSCSYFWGNLNWCKKQLAMIYIHVPWAQKGIPLAQALHFFYLTSIKG